MVNKSPTELSLMSPEEIAAWREQERQHVFGFGYKVDGNGKPIEQGIGSKGNESVNHFAAMKKAESEELLDPGTYDAALAEAWARDRERAIRIGLPRPRGFKRTPQEVR
jgi:hypothetical protein